MPKPHFLIVGAAKSGTTSAYEYLRQHPEVFMPDWKEPSFFAPPEAGGVTTAEEYLALFDQAGEHQVIGEASVAYLYAEDAPQKIMDFLGPETKIIMFLRNPVEMAYSNWGHQTREGFETLSFEEALKMEMSRLNDENFQKNLGCWVANLAYEGRAHYREQVVRFDELFPRKNIKIFIYAEFFKPGLPQWNQLCDFLDISRDYKPKNKAYNVSAKPRSKILQKILRQRMAWKEPLKKILSENVRNEIRRNLEKYNLVETSRPTLDKKTRKKLELLFSEDVAWLEKRLGRSLKEIWF